MVAISLVHACDAREYLRGRILLNKELVGCAFGLRCPELTFYFLKKNTGGEALETMHDVVTTLQHERLPPEGKPSFTLKPRWK
jgi:hypothetical protein